MKITDNKSFKIYPDFLIQGYELKDGIDSYRETVGERLTLLVRRNKKGIMLSLGTICN